MRPCGESTLNCWENGLRIKNICLVVKRDFRLNRRRAEIVRAIYRNRDIPGSDATIVIINCDCGYDGYALPGPEKVKHMIGDAVLPGDRTRVRIVWSGRYRKC